jgi:hypothetical protein
MYAAPRGNAVPTVHTFIDLYFSPGNDSPLELATRIRERTGLEFIIGPHDLVFEWGTVDQFRRTLAQLHEALAGSGVLYRVETVRDEPTYEERAPWPPALRDAGPAPHPAYDRRE